LRDVRIVKIAVGAEDIEGAFIPLHIEVNTVMGGSSDIRLKFVLSGAETADAEPEFPVVFKSGNGYLVPAAAYHATNDALSMMAPMLYEDAYIEFIDGNYEITLYFITAYVQPPYGFAQLAQASGITSINYKDAGDGSFKAADSFGYDALRDTVTVKITVSDISGDISVQITTGSTSAIRLRLSVGQSEIAEGEPEFPVAYKEGGSYLVAAEAQQAIGIGTALAAMADALYENVYITVAGGKYEVTMYIATASIRDGDGAATGVLQASDITLAMVRTPGPFANDPVDSFEYDALRDVLAVKITVSAITPTTAYIILTTGSHGELAFRLALSREQAELAENKPEFPVVFTQEQAIDIPVVAWKSYEDSPSMMAPLLYEYAYVEVIGDGEIEVTLYFVAATVMGIAVSAADYYNMSCEASIESVVETYDGQTDVRSVKITLASAEDLDTPIAVTIGYVGPMGGTSQVIRLKFTPNQAVAADGEPQFESVEVTEPVE
jgi:hypothetical protein